jgi:hypothetical protein
MQAASAQKLIGSECDNPTARQDRLLPGDESAHQNSGVFVLILEHVVA